MPCRIAAEVNDFAPERFFERKQVRHLARVTQFGVASALLCLEDAGWRERAGDGRLGVIAGISNSAQDVAETIFDVVSRHGYRRTLPYFLTKAFPHSTATEVGLATGFQDSVMTLATACTSGLNAIGSAAEDIRTGKSDALLCTSTDATITRCTMACFCRAGMVSQRNDDPQHASRPFDAKRDGGVLGEGAASILLEELGHAQRRGARIYGQVLGWGSTGIGYGGEPEVMIPRGMVAAIRQAMATANCGPDALDYVGCHGVSDPLLDIWETSALKQALGEAAYHLPISSIKHAVGIPQNAAGTLQLVATLMALREDVIPPTGNYEYADPACDLDYVPNTPRRNRIRQALVFSHGFNGSDAAVVVGRMPSA
jgi:3-oxoacyl-[acyl-carrier-protein] synthase II